MLAVDDLDDTTVERAGALVAREQAVARQVRPQLPVAFEDAGACAAALQRLRDGGYRGLVVSDGGRTVAVMTALVRQTPTGGRYVRLPPEGFAADPDRADPTGILAAAFAELASPLIADGVLCYYLVHAALPRLSEALSNLGFGRNGVYGIQPITPRRGSPAVAVRPAGAGDLDTVARLALVEIQHRSAPPMFSPAQDPSLADLAAEHGALREAGAVQQAVTGAGRSRERGMASRVPARPGPRGRAPGRGPRGRRGPRI
jgi:hypothetical protein